MKSQSWRPTISAYENEAGNWLPCTCFSFEDTGMGTLCVERRCPKCGRWLRDKNAVCKMRWNDTYELEGFECAKCGDVTPRVIGWF